MRECVDVFRNEGNSALAALIWCTVDRRDYFPSDDCADGWWGF